MSVLDQIPTDLTPFKTAAEIKRRASTLGFDWTDLRHLLSHADEELQEIREAIASGDKAAITDEMGDLLFIIANLARFTDTDADEALSGAIQKFSRRFRCVENLILERGLTPQTADLESLWKEAKQRTKPDICTAEKRHDIQLLQSRT